MAIYKSVRNNQGIKTLYHKIKDFTANGDTIRVRVYSFVNADFRDKEKRAIALAEAAADRQSEINQRQSELQALMNQNTDGSKTEEIKQKTAELNDLVLDTSDVTESVPGELHATESDITLQYFEPLTMEALYGAIVAGDNELAGGTEA